MSDSSATCIAQAEKWSARNYHPLPVVLSHGEGAWVTDVEGRRFLDMLSSYSAVNQGHRHPRILAAARTQLDRITLTSRAFHNDRMGSFLEALCAFTGYPKALPMNTGAEAVETAIKAMRKWAWQVKGLPEGSAEIIVADGNFHGRTTTIVGFSTEEQYRAGFGPFTPGFRVVPYGDLEALEAAIGPQTAGVLLEPIQGEGGIVVPPDGYLAGVSALCRKAGVLLAADEIQTGLGRTGRVLACHHEDVRPDLVCLGKALGGGVYPVSAVVADEAVLGVFQPGDHGSTFGGNPLGAAIGEASLEVLRDEGLVERAARLGTLVIERLRSSALPIVSEVRGRGLMIGIDLAPHGARPYCEELMRRGILVKETHHSVIRLAPPLVIEEEDLLWAVEQILEVLAAAEPAS